MLRPRIIPCLLYRNNGLVKTFRFNQHGKSDKYVGDPINAVRIFNEKEVDELFFIDIDASAKNQRPNFNLIANIASECRMPLCYGGGIRSVDEISHIISMGVEKVALSSAAIENTNIITESARRFGSQSIVVVIDYKKHGFKETVFTRNGRHRHKESIQDIAVRSEQAGAGEIVLNSIDRDGMQTGYDIAMAKQIMDTIQIPLTILGGASSWEDIIDLFKHCGIIGAAAGSLFVFKGKYNAVLINYPNRAEKNSIIERADIFAN